MATKRKRFSKRPKRAVRRKAVRKKPDANQRRIGFEVLVEARASKRSPNAAARRAGTTLATVRRQFPLAFRRTAAGRWMVRPSDPYVRRMQILTPEGTTGVSVRGSRGASKLASYWDAVDEFLKTGDATRLHTFDGVTLRVGSGKRVLITDESLIEQLGAVGEVSFEDLYQHVA